MGITRIVIAHRSETIMAADRIFSLEGGTLKEIIGRPPRKNAGDAEEQG
jgi:ABC-type bacteriocin/lantibiotic exporter with double-glycine peptidase domain